MTGACRRGRPGRIVWACLALGAAVQGRAGEPAAIRALPVRTPGGVDRPLGDVLGNAPAVVTVWATYCAPCRAEVPVLNAAARRFASAGLRVVGVAADVDDDATLATARQRWGIRYETFRVPVAARERLQALLPKGLPTTFLVRGATVTRHDELLSEERLATLLASRFGLGAGARRRLPDGSGLRYGAEPTHGRALPAALRPRVVHLHVPARRRDDA